MATAASHNNAAYRGRFAPSPSGPLHLGSLFTALASFLDARHAGGTWLLRLEDIDPPREPPGAAQAILDCLDAHQLTPDAPTLFQSSRGAAYDKSLDLLDRAGLLFPCVCTRRELGPGGACRARCHPRPGDETALRVRVTGDFDTGFTDLIQGEQHIENTDVAADFVVRRKDGLYAYQLAVAVDEDMQGITHVIRGIDLLPTTFQQRYLQRVLGLSSPAYGHVPVITDVAGRKLSKQNHAPAVSPDTPLENLCRLLALLNQPVPDAATSEELLERAASHWDRDALYGLTRIVER